MYFSILPTFAFSQQALASINGWNAYVHLPDDYHSTGTKTYPAIIFLPGTDEVGTDKASLLVYGPASFLAGGWNGNVTVDGATVKPIIIALQPSDLWLQPSLLDQQIESIKKQYRVDPARVSLTGLSMGGWAAEFYVQADSNYAAKIASVVAIQAIRPDDNPAYPAPFAAYARNHGHWLGYEQINDFRDMQAIANTMNAASSGSATYLQTNVNGGSHCCWNTWYDPAHTDNYSINGVKGNYSIYQYMLSYPNTPGTSRAASVSTPPAVNAGNDQTINLLASPTGTIAATMTLSGKATPANGDTIRSTIWTRSSGGSATITSSSSLFTTVTGLTTGNYTFTLTATNNKGLSSSSKVNVTITAPAPFAAPPVRTADTTLSAGKDQTISLQDTSLVLKGTASDTAAHTSGSTPPKLSASSQPLTDSAATAEKLTVYPNPVRDVLTINWESNYRGKAVISFYDVTGRSLQTLPTSKDGSYFTSQLSLSALKTGVYFLKIQLENGKIITQQIMKQ